MLDRENGAEASVEPALVPGLGEFAVDVGRYFPVAVRQAASVAFCWHASSMNRHFATRIACRSMQALLVRCRPRCGRSVVRSRPWRWAWSLQEMGLPMRELHVRKARVRRGLL